MAGTQAGKTVQYNGQVFERIRVLGKGSFGTAIVHKRQHDNALVVLKEIDLVELKRDSDRLSAIQEARIMSNLSHQNIIKYHNAYTTDTKLIIEMEYARLGNLQAYLTYQNRLLSEREVFQIFRQVLFGLDYLHSRQIVHLDLKMANIFVTSEGSIKIGDFGIAKFINSSSDDLEGHTRVGVKTGSQNPCHYHVGTLAYSSPERCLGERTDFKSDIWSLGCILYELATLKPLFASESLAELVLSITRVQHEPLQRSDIRPAIRSLFERMISCRPSDRPSSSELVSLTDRILLQIQQVALTKRRQTSGRSPLANHQVSRCPNELSNTDALAINAASPLQNTGLVRGGPINYKHSLLYQVRLDSHDIQVERVNLPQSKRIREIARGRSHYLVLTYDDIVYGWGSKHKGQLGACNLFRASQPQQQQYFGSSRSPSSISRSGKVVRHSQSARASLTARDLQLFSPSFWAPDARSRLSYSPFEDRATRARTETTISSLTQPPSLSSSTQTILAPSGQPQCQSLSSLMADYQAKRSLENHSKLLAASQPAIKPIVISELNKRRIFRVAAGRDFSVFLSRTGIVLTCGDGSRGCLGRGNLSSSFQPCMVDKLLNMDVFGIACGPEHVVAICSNGQVFAWGNSQDGRLGISFSDVDHRDVCASRYVTRPQLIHFDADCRLLPGCRPERQANETNRGNVFIKSAHCGDRCTVFIDSNQQVWACGLNSSNRLGLDRARCFKRTVIVEHSTKPVKVAVLSKERIVSCSIGKNHATYITSEGKMLVLGQDIDHSYRLRVDLASDTKRESLLKRAASGLQRLSSSWSLTSNQVYLKRHTHSTGETSESIKRLDHESLLKSLLDEDRLGGFKRDRSSSLMELANRHQQTSRFARNQVEMYLRKSRALKRLPFDGILAASSTSKFSLVLTNDNRIYFWGTRTHKLGDGGETTSQIDRLLGPRLVPNHLDDCFIKVGAANSSLMESIQVLGSDQPIILARNPQLTARSLRDLWILDYEPLEEPSTVCSSSSSISSQSLSSCEFDLQQANLLPDSCAGSLKESHVGYSGANCTSSLGRLHSSYSSLQSLEHTTTSLYSRCSNDEHCEGKMNHSGLDCKRHDAIIEPQPIVSLYVPSMFNHGSCALQLVNLFSFDEDRFFLVLDTTVKYHGHSNLAPTSENGLKLGATQRRASISQRHTGNQVNQLLAPQQTSRKLNIVEELKSGSSSTRPNHVKLDQRAPQNNWAQDEVSYQNQTDDLIDSSNHIEENGSDRLQSPVLRSLPASQKDTNGSQREECRISESTGESNAALTQESQQISPISNNCLSLEEPISMSTFAPGFDGNNIAILGRESPMGDCESLRRLSFERSQQMFDCELGSDGGNQQLAQEHQAREQDHRFAAEGRGNHHRRRLFMRTRNRSESTVATGSFEDDTTSMPTWVRNEYHQQMFSTDGERNNEVDGNDGNSSVSTLIGPERGQQEEESWLHERRPTLQ